MYGRSHYRCFFPDRKLTVTLSVEITVIRMLLLSFFDRCLLSWHGNNSPVIYKVYMKCKLHKVFKSRLGTSFEHRFPNSWCTYLVCLFTTYHSWMLKSWCDFSTKLPVSSSKRALLVQFWNGGWTNTIFRLHYALSASLSYKLQSMCTPKSPKSWSPHRPSRITRSICVTSVRFSR